MVELAGKMGEYYRPNLFVNTPDINPYYLQASGRPGFIVRATLAATLSSNWGLYSGFELCKTGSLPGREEYLNSEKFEIKVRNFNIIGRVEESHSCTEPHPPRKSGVARLAQHSGPQRLERQHRSLRQADAGTRQLCNGPRQSRSAQRAGVHL